jgi:hypothetical protein
MERTDKFSEYAELRTNYIARLEEANLLDSRGLLRGDVAAGLVGYVIQGSPLDKYCRENPTAPICLVADGARLADEFIDHRREYDESLKERDLLDVQSMVTDVIVAGGLAGGDGSVGLLTPDQDIDDFGPLGPLVTAAGMSPGNIPLQIAALY